MKKKDDPEIWIVFYYDIILIVDVFAILGPNGGKAGAYNKCLFFYTFISKNGTVCTIFSIELKFFGLKTSTRFKIDRNQFSRIL